MIPKIYLSELGVTLQIRTILETFFLENFRKRTNLQQKTVDF